jgi:enterochelin esterase-like enzyme
MIVAMLNGYPNSHDGGGVAAGRSAVETELVTDIIPSVEKSYRALTSRDDRAIAGLSMGGDQSFVTALRHPELFAWVGEFSGAFISDAGFDLNTSTPAFLPDATRMNGMFRLLFLSCGTDDERYPGHLDLIDRLNSTGIKHMWFSTAGAHEWKVWRRSLIELLPRLFKLNS